MEMATITGQCRSLMPSDYAYFNNTSVKGEAGSIADLYQSTVNGWHVDMAGKMRREETGYFAKSATGFGVGLLADFIGAGFGIIFDNTLSVKNLLLDLEKRENKRFF